MISFQAINIDMKCKNLLNFFTVTLWHSCFFFFPIYRYICKWSSSLSCGHLYSGWYHSICMLITDIIFCQRTMHICQYVHILFVFPCYSSQSSFILVFISPNFSLSFLPKSLRITFWFGQAVPRQFMAFVCKLLNKPGQKKLPMWSQSVSNRSLKKVTHTYVFVTFHTLYPFNLNHHYMSVINNNGHVAVKFAGHTCLYTGVLLLFNVSWFLT
jgi:hypothetical protein